MSRRRSDFARLAAGIAAIATVCLVYVGWLHVANPATVSTTFLMIVLVTAATSRLWTAVAISFAAMLAFNFFFLPPVGTFTIADPQNWVALFAFLAVSLVASNLSAVARSQTEEARARRDELTRLFDLSRDVLMTSDSGGAVEALARAISRRFDLGFVAVALPHATEWEISGGGTLALTLDPQQLWTAFLSAQSRLEFDAYARTYSGHRAVSVEGHEVHLVPLRSGTKPIGLLAAAGRPIEAGTLDALAGIAAIAIERAQFLDERKQAELTRQSEQLKATLLASLAHDLRTPLTAIRVAATNVRSAVLPEDQRIEQSDLVLAETEHLTRLFDNVLEMARIDAGAVTAEVRWTHPAEIIAGAQTQVQETLRDRVVNVTLESDVPVRLDPRLAATALAHILENAAHYTPSATSIDISAGLGPDGLTIRVRDHGPGIAASELSHLFERFFRGDAGKSRTSGTGMGLWIARGLLAVQGGHIWAENCSDGGAQFSLTIPVSVKDADTDTSPLIAAASPV